MTTTTQTEATAIVHAGLPDVLTWLGETPVTEHKPRHTRAHVNARLLRGASEQLAAAGVDAAHALQALAAAAAPVTHERRRMCEAKPHTIHEEGAA